MDRQDRGGRGDAGNFPGTLSLRDAGPWEENNGADAAGASSGSVSLCRFTGSAASPGRKAGEKSGLVSGPRPFLPGSFRAGRTAAADIFPDGGPGSDYICDGRGNPGGIAGICMEWKSESGVSGLFLVYPGGNRTVFKRVQKPSEPGEYLSSYQRLAGASVPSGPDPAAAAGVLAAGRTVRPVRSQAVYPRGNSGKHF